MSEEDSEKPGASGLGPGTIALAAVALVVAAALAGFLGANTSSEPQLVPAAPQRGVACPHLSDAFRAFHEGDRIALEDSVARAALASERALDTSGQLFGRPEEIALRLSALDDGSDAEIGTLLAKASKACRRLNRWPSVPPPGES